MKFLIQTAMMLTASLLVSMSAFAESGAAEHGNPHPDLSLVFKGVNFIILVVGLIFLVRRPIRDFFAQRSLLMKQSVEKSREFYEKALKESQDIQAKLAQLHSESQQILNSNKESAEEEGKKIMEQAEAFVEKIDKDARRLVQSEISRANEELKDLTIKHIQSLAHEYIQKEITSKDEDKLVSKFLDRLQAN